MPSRKNDSSDSQSASRRSSLRRLSSIASFQTLFGRRRSNNTTDSVINSSSSNLSLSSSTIANAPEPIINTNRAVNAAQDEDTLTELPPPRPVQSNFTSKRSSYVCLPDDPIGGMPRSRTFSNLPLPTRNKRTAPLVSSKSSSRLPTAFLPSTRLPSPPTTNRKHSHTRLASAGVNVPVTRSRMKRSDTEPLLGVNVSASNHPQRSTAFKENISLSPIKPLPAMDMSDCSDYYSLSPKSGLQPHSPPWQDTNQSDRPLVSANFASASPFSFSYPQHPAVRPREYKSSPAYRSAKDRPPTPGGSKGLDMQRWASQPILANTTNVTQHMSQHQHQEIKQTRLMSARQAPTAPPPKTPVAAPQNGSSKLKSIKTLSHVRTSSSISPTRSTPTPTKPKAASPIPKHLQVHAREPPSYWLGRLCALVDRYRNEELSTLPSNSSSDSKSRSRSASPFSRLSPNSKSKSKEKHTPKHQTDKLHTPEANTARLQHAFSALHDLCSTQEAKESLISFQAQYANKTKCSELAPRMKTRTIVLDAPTTAAGIAESTDGENSECGEVVVGGVSETRKMSFMDRLLGRQQLQQGKRRSLVLS